MVENTLKNQDSYELMQNDNGDVMVMLYANDSKPSNPSFCINEYMQQLELSRNAKDVILIEELQPETLEKLKTLNTIYVCELKYNQEHPDAEDAEIVYAYAATLKKKEPFPPRPKKEATLQEKAQQSREKILEKRNNEEPNNNK